MLKADTAGGLTNSSEELTVGLLVIQAKQQQKRKGELIRLNTKFNPLIWASDSDSLELEDENTHTISLIRSMALSSTKVLRGAVLPVDCRSPSGVEAACDTGVAGSLS